MTALPTFRAVATPLLSIVATELVSEPQVTKGVISWLVPSEYTPVAVNDFVNPLGMLGSIGATMMAVNVAGCAAAPEGPVPLLLAATRWLPPPPPHAVKNAIANTADNSSWTNFVMPPKA
jgi:hypothetical protein